MMRSNSKRKRVKERNHGKGRRKRNVDIISQLPDHLIYQILLELPTKDSVTTSVLSTRWRNLWKHVSGLEFSYADLEYDDLEVFVDRFLAFDKKSLIRQFRLRFDDQDEFSIDTSGLEKWINVVLTRGLEHLVIESFSVPDQFPIELPIGICTCETLVRLELSYVNLEGFDSVSLPRLKTMHLGSVWFSSDASLERLISSSPILQVLKIVEIQSVVEVLRVSSQSLTSLCIKYCNYFSSDDGETYGLVIDAPSLKYLCLGEDKFKTIALNRVGSSTKMDINLNFVRYLNLNDVSKMEEALGSFLVGISNVMDLKISCSTLKAIYAYSRLAPLPQFPNLTRLRAFPSTDSEILPTFLASCPNLKSLYLDSGCPNMEKITSAAVPECMLTSLEFVEIEISIEKHLAERELVRYILRNAAVLTKLVLRLDCSRAKERCQLFEQLLMFPRRSSVCQVGILYG